jgi:hypothetical protein
MSRGLKAGQQISLTFQAENAAVARVSRSDKRLGSTSEKCWPATDSTQWRGTFPCADAIPAWPRTGSGGACTLNRSSPRIIETCVARLVVAPADLNAFQTSVTLVASCEASQMRISVKWPRGARDKRLQTMLLRMSTEPGWVERPMGLSRDFFKWDAPRTNFAPSC